MAKKKRLKIGINSLISWGASIVIIGLMFKILHWKNGEILIAFALVTESILFFILGFQAESTDPDWTRIYPELDEDYKGDLPSSSIQKPAEAAAVLDKMMADAKIGPELIQSLGTGLRTFGEKVSTISTMADASLATNEFTGKLKTASNSFDNLSKSFDNASENLVEMAKSGVDSRSYHEQLNNMAKNLSALNAVYELELQDSSSYLKSMNKFYQSLSLTMHNFNESTDDSKTFKEEVGKLAKKLSELNTVYELELKESNSHRESMNKFNQNLSFTMQNFNESMDDSKTFKEEVGKLAKNLSSLNAIYGNMLTAMNQPRT